VKKVCFCLIDQWMLFFFLKQTTTNNKIKNTWYIEMLPSPQTVTHNNSAHKLRPSNSLQASKSKLVKVFFKQVIGKMNIIRPQIWNGWRYFKTTNYNIKSKFLNTVIITLKIVFSFWNTLKYPNVDFDIEIIISLIQNYG
jgi:hypothetical protein